MVEGALRENGFPRGFRCPTRETASLKLSAVLLFVQCEAFTRVPSCSLLAAALAHFFCCVSGLASYLAADEVPGGA